MRRLSLMIVAVLSLAFHSSAQTSKTPSFSNYPSTVERARVKAINFKKNPGARSFRMRLTEALKGGVNFAGHYVMASWGCGTACIDSGIIDARNGKVYSPDELGTVVDWFLEAENTDFGLEYRMNSRLLVITGTPGTDRRAGKFYYEWKDNRLRFVKFVKEESN